MKVAVIIILFASSTAFADWGDACSKWFDYLGQSGPYEAMRQQMPEEQIAENFPDMIRDYRRAKTKFHLAKAKYEKTSKKKFDPATCK